MARHPQRLLGRDHGAMRLGQRHRRHAARRAGLPFDGRLLPGDGQASGDAAGARAVERARHHRQGPGRRRLGRDLPDGEQRRRSQGAGLLCALSAQGQAQQRPDPRRRLRLGHALSGDGQRRSADHPDDRDPGGDRQHRRHPATCRASAASMSARAISACRSAWCPSSTARSRRSSKIYEKLADRHQEARPVRRHPQRHGELRRPGDRHGLPASSPSPTTQA